MSLAAARFVSSAVNPFLALCLLVAIYRGWRRGDLRIRKFAGASAGALAVTYAGVHLFRAAKLWPGHPWFPSGHETFAISIVTSLMTRDARWAVLMPLLVLLGYSLVRAGYHDWLDIGGAALWTPPFVLAWHQLIRLWIAWRQRVPR